MNLFFRKTIIRLFIGLSFLSDPKVAIAQANKSYLAFGLGYDNNLHELTSSSVNVVGEIPIRKGSPIYANFHWSLGWVQYGGLHIASNLAAVTTFVVFAEDAYNSHLAAEAAGILMIIPTGITYYLRDSMTSRYGVYLNPLGGNHFSFEEEKQVLSYSPEIGFKSQMQLQNKTYFYTSAGCAYTMALKEGSSDIKPSKYLDAPMLKLSVGLAFFGPNEKRKCKK